MRNRDTLGHRVTYVKRLTIVSEFYRMKIVKNSCYLVKLCDFIDCHNGGTCTNDRTLEACFRCTCTAGFTGENCETTVTLPRK